jgi:hypothetical protein
MSKTETHYRTDLVNALATIGILMDRIESAGTASGLPDLIGTWLRVEEISNEKDVPNTVESSWPVRIETKYSPVTWTEKQTRVPQRRGQYAHLRLHAEKGAVCLFAIKYKNGWRMVRIFGNTKKKEGTDSFIGAPELFLKNLSAEALQVFVRWILV